MKLRPLPMPYGFDVAPYLSSLLERASAEPFREVTVYKGRSVGPTTGILENVIGCAIDYDGMQDWPPAPSAPPPNVAEIRYADAFAFAGSNYEGEPRWSTAPSDPIADIKAAWKLLTRDANTPEVKP